MKFDKLAAVAAASASLLSGCFFEEPPSQPTVEFMQEYVQESLKNCPLATVNSLQFLEDVVVFKDGSKYLAFPKVSFRINIAPLTNLAQLKAEIEEKRVTYAELQKEVRKYESAKYVTLRKNIERKYDAKISQLNPDYRYEEPSMLSFGFKDEPPLPEEKLEKYRKLLQERAAEIQKYYPPTLKMWEAKRAWESARESIPSSFDKQCKANWVMLEAYKKTLPETPEYLKKYSRGPINLPGEQFSAGGELVVNNESFTMTAKDGKWLQPQ